MSCASPFMTRKTFNNKDLLLLIEVVYDIQKVNKKTLGSPGF